MRLSKCAKNSGRWLPLGLPFFAGLVPASAEIRYRLGRPEPSLSSIRGMVYLLPIAVIGSTLRALCRCVLAVQRSTVLKAYRREVAN
ncbi:MAG: hypothetical protein AAF355_06865 [Myxococcota bacterium]